MKHVSTAQMNFAQAAKDAKTVPSQMAGAANAVPAAVVPIFV